MLDVTTGEERRKQGFCGHDFRSTDQHPGAVADRVR